MIALANGPYHAGCSLARHAKGHSALFHVGTRNVQLDGWYVFQFVDAGSTLGIVVG